MITKIRINVFFAIVIAVLISAPVYSNEQPVFDDGRASVVDTDAYATESGAAVDSSPNFGIDYSEISSTDLRNQGVDLSPIDHQAIKGAVPPPVPYYEGVDQSSSFPATEAVLESWDSRIRVYPTSSNPYGFPSAANVLILFGGGYMCSGTMIDTDLVLTAGHCVHEGGTGISGWYTRSSYTVYPGYDGSTAPYGSCGASWLASVNGWTEDARDDYDYGVIKLNCSVGNSTGWFGFFDKGQKNKQPAIISGYPGDKPSYTQWLATGQVKKKSKRKLFYKNDTYGGMSGSGIWYDKDPGGDQCATGGPCIVGVHAYRNFGTKKFYRDHNSGTRIDKNVFSNLLFWKSEP